MMNVTTIRFTLYDENGVACATTVCPLRDLYEVLNEGMQNMPHSHYLRVSKGKLWLDELQLVEDSVEVFSYHLDEEFGYSLDDPEQDRNFDVSEWLAHYDDFQLVVAKLNQFVEEHKKEDETDVAHFDASSGDNSD